MDKKKLKEFRDQLLIKQADLTEGFARTKSEATQGPVGGTEDFVDYAISAYTKEFLLSLSDLDRRTLQLVDESLARIERGQFGTCLECAKTIGEKRLDAVPWTPCCIACQEKLEQEESRMTTTTNRPMLE